MGRLRQKGISVSTLVGVGTNGGYVEWLSSTGGTAGSGFTGTGGMAGQTFTPDENFNLGRAHFRFWSAGMTGDMTAAVYSTSAGVPDTKIDDATTTIDVATLPTSDPGPTVLNFSWDFDAVALTSGTMYAIVYFGTGLVFTSGNYFIAGRNVDVYASGTQVYISSGWTASPEGWDLDFKIDKIT
jgi:hypothetical protein